MDRSDLSLRPVRYATALGQEVFLQFVDTNDSLAAFARLSLPELPVDLAELENSALLREVHVYGHLVPIGGRSAGRSQHLGLGRQLIEEAARLARDAGFRNLAVISSIGTREYYRGLGFTDGDLYQHLELEWRGN